MPSEDSPIGQPTRGKTTRNRLRRIDIFLIRYDPELIKRSDTGSNRSLYVDLGFGAEPATTLESASRFRKLNPSLHILGVEIDPERVSAAAACKTAEIDFRLGGFNLPLKNGETVRMIRAFNVLRQYPPEQYADAVQLMADQLSGGGLLVEGTSDPFGRVWCANLFRVPGPGQISYEGLAFSTSFRYGFDPAHLQPVLPKNLIHQMGSLTEIHAFFEEWKDAAARSIHFKQYGLRQWFIASAHLLATRGYQLDLRKKMLRAGFLTWKNPPLSISPT